MEGLQIKRFAWTKTGMEPMRDGVYSYFSDAEKFHSALQEALGKNMLLQSNLDTDRKCIEEQKEVLARVSAERDKMLNLLKDSATQVICVKCHTMSTYDGKKCTVCGGDKMIEPIRVLDHKAVEELIGEVKNEGARKDQAQNCADCGDEFALENPDDTTCEECKLQEAQEAHDDGECIRECPVCEGLAENMEDDR